MQKDKGCHKDSCGYRQWCHKDLWIHDNGATRTLVDTEPLYGEDEITGVQFISITKR